MYDIIFKTGNSLDRGSLPGEYVARCSFSNRKKSIRNVVDSALLHYPRQEHR
jgi:hypothetical protein